MLDPRLVWDAREDRTAVTTSTEYRVMLLEGGSPVREIRRRIPPERVTFEDAVREEKFHLAEEDGETLELADCPIPWKEWVEKNGFRSRLQVVDEIRVDPKGRLWVRRNAVAGKGPIDVFDETGVYLGTLPPDAPYPVAFASASRFAATYTGELGIPHVAVYRIAEDGSGGGPVLDPADIGDIRGRRGRLRGLRRRGSGLSPARTCGPRRTFHAVPRGSA